MRIRSMRSIGVCFAAFLALTALGFFPGAGFVRAADDDFFLRQQIDVPGVIIGSRAADFNGDGMIDIGLFVSDSIGRRLFYSYIQREGGRFPPTAGQTITLSNSADVVQFLDLDADRATELLVMDRDGLWRYRFADGRFSDKAEPLAAKPTTFLSGIENGLLPQNCVHTISGRPVAFLPVANGYSLWEYAQGKFTEIGELSAPQRSYLSERPIKLFGDHAPAQSGQYIITCPEIVIGDGNGDSLDDVYMIWPDRLALFTQNDKRPLTFANPVSFSFQDVSEGNLCQSRLVDYDRDGRLDVVCSRSLGGISGAHTEIAFVSAADIARGRRLQTYSVTLTDACGNLIVDDIDGNGRPELVVPAIELGILSTVQKMITKKTDLHVLVYPIDSLGRPSEDPTIRRKISCRLDFGFADPAAEIRVNWSGDYDGDGLADLVIADGGGQLLFYRGMANDFVEDKASLVVDMPGPYDIRPVHLNNDGRHDLMITHRPVSGRSRMTVLVTNRIG